MLMLAKSGMLSKKLAADGQQREGWYTGGPQEIERWGKGDKFYSLASCRSLSFHDDPLYCEPSWLTITWIDLRVAHMSTPLLSFYCLPLLWEVHFHWATSFLTIKYNTSSNSSKLNLGDIWSKASQNKFSILA